MNIRLEQLRELFSNRGSILPQFCLFDKNEKYLRTITYDTSTEYDSRTVLESYIEEFEDDNPVICVILDSQDMESSSSFDDAMNTLTTGRTKHSGISKEVEEKVKADCVILTEDKGQEKPVINKLGISESLLNEIHERLGKLKIVPLAVTKGYWRDQILFLERYIADGVDSELLRYALRGINPLDIIDDINCFYDSSSYLCSDMEYRPFIGTVKEWLKKHIVTFNILETRIQYPVPNKDGAIDGHKLMTFNYHTRVFTLYTKNSDGSISTDKYNLEFNYK